MIPKLKPLQKQIYSHISNAISLGMSVEEITKEVAKRFPTYYIFHKVDKTMQEELVSQLIWMYVYTTQGEQSKDFK